MKVVQELVTYFDKRGKLSRKQLLKILDQNQVASDPPSNMHGICDTKGAVHYYRITGVAEGQVWGSGPYTRDSVMGAAAVHAGLLKPGETAVLRLTVMPALKSYPGTLRNGVTTSDYAEFPDCWQLSAI
jgi:LCCL domain